MDESKMMLLCKSRRALALHKFVVFYCALIALLIERIWVAFVKAICVRNMTSE